MNDTVFKILELVIMVCSFLISAFLIPWLKNKLGADKVALIEQWVNKAVLSAQQTMWDQTGEDRKKSVVDFVHKMCTKHNIEITDEQIDILIQAAVKQMKIDEGVVYGADKGDSAASEKDAKDQTNTGEAKEQG